MTKRKLKETPQDTDTESTNGSEVAVLERPASEPNHEAIPTSPEQGGEPSSVEDGKQFRSWVVDTALGFTRLTDDINHRIVLQFEKKPEPEILTAMKTAGFQYKPDYFGQKNCWVRRNDFEGRMQVENLEKMLKKAMGRV
jgi:hypothetical protein